MSKVNRWGPLLNAWLWLGAAIAFACGATVTHSAGDGSGGVAGTPTSGGASGTANASGSSNATSVGGSGNVSGTSNVSGAGNVSGVGGTGNAPGGSAGNEAGESGNMAGATGGDVNCYGPYLDQLCNQSYRVYVCLDSVDRAYYHAIYIANDGFELDCYSISACSFVLRNLEDHLCTAGEGGAAGATP